MPLLDMCRPWPLQSALRVYLALQVYTSRMPAINTLAELVTCMYKRCSYLYLSQCLEVNSSITFCFIQTLWTVIIRMRSVLVAGEGAEHHHRHQHASTASNQRPSSNYQPARAYAYIHCYINYQTVRLRCRLGSYKEHATFYFYISNSWLKICYRLGVGPTLILNLPQKPN